MHMLRARKPSLTFCKRSCRWCKAAICVVYRMESNACHLDTCIGSYYNGRSIYKSIPVRMGGSIGSAVKFDLDGNSQWHL